jgi:hypothetical protein
LDAPAARGDIAESTLIASAVLAAEALDSACRIAEAEATGYKNKNGLGKHFELV